MKRKSVIIFVGKCPLKQGFIYFVGADSHVCPFFDRTNQGEHGSSPLRGINVERDIWNFIDNIYDKDYNISRKLYYQLHCKST